MLEKVRRYVEKYQMLTKEDGVIVGVSGGADSVCLLLVLLELQKEIGFELAAVHVNHGLRGIDADSDEAYVKRLCEERCVPLETYFVDVAFVAKERKQSTEEAGREVRRECFERAGSKYKATKVALAHHQNDNAETMLFRLARGTGIKGLGGMAPMAGKYIRPLLCVEREEIEAYLEGQGIKYCIDETNESDEYTRNRVRNHLIPYMERELNEKTVSHINDTMDYMRQVQEYLEEQTHKYKKMCLTQTEKGYCILQAEYQRIPEVLRPILIKNVLVDICQREKDLESAHLNQIEELFARQTGRKIHLPYGMEAKRIYDGVEIYRKMEEYAHSPEEFFFCLEEQSATYEWHNQKICCRILNKLQIDGETLEKSHTKCFDCDIIKNGISFRTRRPGDYITIHSDGRKQKLKSYFINEKVPQEERDKVLLVADGNHVLWIVGYRVNCAYQVNENTKRVLEVHVDKGEENGREN